LAGARATKTKKSSKSSGKKSSTRRKSRGSISALPVFIQGACEFSDDPHGLDDALWIVRAIKRELIGGGGAVGNLWQELRDELDRICVKKEGRQRLQGDWLLLYVGYVMSKQPEMQEFWKRRALSASGPAPPSRQARGRWERRSTTRREKQSITVAR
jgi:hypothetical protein